MKHSLKNYIGLPLLAVSIAGTSAANADTKGYLVDSNSDPVLDGNAECVISALGPNLRYCSGAPQITLKEEAVAPVVNRKVSMTDDLNFEFDSSELTGEAKTELNKIISELNEISVSEVELVGHTDSVGSSEYNKALSNRRADAVESYLINNGIRARVINEYGMGERQPVASNETSDGRAENRRVDIMIRGFNMANR